MTIYHSQLTPKGNSSYSHTSQAEADARAAALDANGCTYCMNCTDCMNCTNCTNCMGCTGCTGCMNCTKCTKCTRCTDCHDCTHCYGCTDCHDCTHCTNCLCCMGCTGCTGCMNCTKCTRCTKCTGCTNCTGDVIQAGLPNGWPCYGWLKNGQLIIHCGCRRKTFAEAVKYWSNKPDRLEVLMACHYIASVAHSRGWKV